MMAKRGNDDIVPMSEMGHMDDQQYTDYCADLCEQVLSGTIDWEQAANLMFGDEPEVTYTRWTS